jgi:hypothetical protein
MMSAISWQEQATFDEMMSAISWQEQGTFDEMMSAISWYHDIADIFSSNHKCNLFLP